ncbi:MAG: DUF1097 domain-containing protein [Infirmifilum sp.]|jgi:hypothetical protein|uniref:DUF1097 domain-containing protein n=1 Tax=Infirmifilum uzonense TaxID=1550241 RepID=A0A0F7FGQ6_9CREN|nr:DUF1097 domain-containing protein [Infirmifilum uzonense]AKG38339.1 hypothetical protein MA03_02310 [Infirmifilum uzonense]
MSVKYKIPIEITVAYLAALSLLVTLPPLGLPVWATFVTWAGYFALGADKKAFRELYKAIPLGGIFGWLAVVGFDFAIKAMPGIHWIIPVMIVEFLDVLVLMYIISWFKFVGAAVFFAFPSYFGTYYGGFFPKTGDLITDATMALVWQVAANLLGPIFGFLSIYLSFPEKR